jgi:MSHA biogenesis protein MshN
MSIINQMLQELDRRHAPAGANGAAPPMHVRTVAPPNERRYWFWGALSVLIVAAIAWGGWLAYQLVPRRIATDSAFKAADEARTRAPTPTPAPAPAPSAPMTSTPVAPVPEQPASDAPTPPPAAEAQSAPQVEMLRLAESIATPILEANPAAGAPAPAAAKPPAPAKLPSKLAVTLPEKPVPPKSVEKPKFERLDRIGPPAERAENEFRSGVAVLKLGRSGEAETRFAKALEYDSTHRGARQALIAMYIERGQLEAARKLLQEGLAIDPAQPDFAIALARILVERKDLPGALAALEGSAPATGEVPEFHVLRGTLLQRLARHNEAAEAYQTALQARSTIPQAWVGLGISLEAMNRRPEAADAFRRALVAGPVSPEVKTFAEQRIRNLR